MTDQKGLYTCFLRPRRFGLSLRAPPPASAAGSDPPSLQMWAPRIEPTAPSTKARITHKILSGNKNSSKSAHMVNHLGRGHEDSSYDHEAHARKLRGWPKCVAADGNTAHERHHRSPGCAHPHPHAHASPAARPEQQNVSRRIQNRWKCPLQPVTLLERHACIR